jgi:hypothetical protein
MTPPVYSTLFVMMALVAVVALFVLGRHLSGSRRARIALTSSQRYQELSDEYRRLSDLAITAQEHTDLRLTEISVRLEELHHQLAQMQHILKEVE